MLTDNFPLLLGSGSPRRLDILRTLRIPTVACPAHADETAHDGEGASAYIERVVRNKLVSVASRTADSTVGGILVADTVVLVDGEILGKPRDAQDACSMLRRLSGRSHEVWTRFAVALPTDPASACYEATVKSNVVFRPLSEDMIRGYASSGEGLDKAGAYAVQGLGSFAVSRIEGSYSNVVGLPACEVVAALLETGLLAAYP